MLGCRLFGVRLSAWCLAVSFTTSCLRDEKAALSLKALDAVFEQGSESPEAEQRSLKTALSSLPVQPSEAPSLRDIELSLEALRHEAKGEPQAALTQWQEALRLAPAGAVGDKIFAGWLRAFLATQTKPYELRSLSQNILQATDQGRLSASMQAQKLGDPERLQAYLAKKLPTEAVQPVLSPEVASPLSQSAVLPPLQKGLPVSDPLLQAAAKSYCSVPQLPQQAWLSWERALAPAARPYWQGLMALCHKRPLEAIAALKVAAPRLAASKKAPLQVLALGAHQQLVKLLRGNDARELAATYYQGLHACWKLPGVTAKGLASSEQDFILNRINDTLWAARYQALVGAYDLAKSYVQEAVEAIELAQSSLPQLTPSLTKDLALLRWEAYEILAARIAYEQQDYAEAGRLTQASLELPSLAQSWQEKSRWHLGFYAYLEGKLEKAELVWHELMTRTKDAALHTKLLFWLARVYDLRGAQSQVEENLRVLAEQSPLSYYHVVAPELAGLPQAGVWKVAFADPLSLEKKLQTASRYQTAALRHDEKIAPQLSKLELLLLAGLRPWALAVSKDLLATTLPRFKLKEEDQAYLYLSRLFYAAENYSDSIRLTSDLGNKVPGFWQEHPEQLHIFFPRAFAQHFRSQAQGDAQTLALLYAITRQESMFLPSAYSPAAAVGLMQLLPATAKRLATTASLSWPNIAERLYDPAVNVALGSVYVRLLQARYQGQLPAVIAAYNAGEYAVDIWQERRKHPDPLVWIEAIPFGETRTYVQQVLRNLAVYSHLDARRSKVVLHKKFYRRQQARLQRLPQNTKH